MSAAIKTRCFWLIAALAVAFCFVPSDTSATRSRRPFNESANVSANFDNNGSAGGCQDYSCGSNCYDTHSGTDFAMPTGRTVVATADGTVVTANSGCADVGCACGCNCMNTCGDR